MSRHSSHRKRRRLRFWAVALTISLVALVFAVRSGSDYVLERLTRAALPRIEQAATQAGVTLDQLYFERADFSRHGLLWRGWVAELTLPARRGQARPPTLQIGADSVRVEMLSWLDRRAHFHIGGLRVTSGLKEVLTNQDMPRIPDGTSVEIERVRDGSLTLRNLDFKRDAADTGREILRGLAQLWTEGRCKLPLQGTVHVDGRVNFHHFDLRLSTERVDEMTVLRMQRSDVLALAGKLELQLTEAEIELLQRYPLRAVPLLQIKEYAAQRARRLARSEDYPEDATRHVLWSYWISRIYGHEFSAEVTEAHELGSSNTPAESAMDRNNNAIGAGYGKNRVPEAEVFTRIKTNPKIVRHPTQSGS